MARKSIYILVATVAAMLVLGIVMLWSTSAYAPDNRGDISYFVKRQGFWMVIGVVLCIVSGLVDYHFWEKTWWVWFGIAVVLLVCCFVPHVGMKVNGSRRWINLGFASLQPSEFAKFAAIVFLSFWYSRYEKSTHTFFKGFVFPMLIVGVLMGLIVVEVDLGSTALIGGTMFLMMFVAGSNLFYLAPLALGGLGGIFYLAMHIDERSKRIMAFMDPEKFQQSEGWQQFMALIALGSGGINGMGLGNGRQKFLYLPEAHTDFILPMIGEELGLPATLGIVTGYVIIMLCAVLIATQARDRFGKVMGIGITMLLMLQAMVNIGVTTSLLPNKGLPLPFISYGGSNLALCLFMIGILINIHRQGELERPLRNRLLVPSRAIFTRI